MNTDVMLFFGEVPQVLALYEKLEAEIITRWPEVTIRVQKSQIAFDNGRRFAFASLRGKRLVVTFGLGERVDSSRIAQAVEPYPGRWTHHVILQDISEMNGELLGWIAQAYHFAARK